MTMFGTTPRTQELRQRLLKFMDAHIYPNEANVDAEINRGDRWQHLDLIDGPHRLVIEYLRPIVPGTPITLRRVREPERLLLWMLIPDDDGEDHRPGHGSCQ